MGTELMAMLPPSTTVTSPTPVPVSSSSLSSTATYSFTPSTEQSQVALPVLMIAGCIVGTCLCGIALAVNHMWRTKTKTRTSFFTQNLRLRISYCLYFLNLCNVTYSIEQGTKKVHQIAKKKNFKTLKNKFKLVVAI